MQHSDETHKKDNNDRNVGKDPEVKAEQQQTDPQITELKGFVDKTEELEPILEDGTKSPEKPPPPNVNK